MKQKVALIFGGRSVESDISVITAVQAYANLDKRLFDVEPVFMSGGEFYVDNMRTLSAFTPFNAAEHTKVVLYGGTFFELKKSKLKNRFRPDVALICCHGGEGENGTLQAVLEYNDIPHTSSGVLASALCIDKAASKEIFDNMLLNVVQNIVISRDEFEEDGDKILFHLESFLTYPMIVKPASLGSSIGIRVARDSDSLLEAIEIACEFDDKIIVEQKLTDFIEVNCAAFAEGNDVILSDTEQPLTANDFLTFDDKYSTGKMSGGGHVIPADIGGLNSIVRANTERLYRELNLNGVVRVDYLVDKNRNKVYINEINTVPGSMANYLFEGQGISYPRLLERVIAASISRAEKASTRRKTFDSGVLSAFKGGSKIKK